MPVPKPSKQLYSQTPKLIWPGGVAWPRPVGWLVPGVNCTPLEYDIGRRLLRDEGTLEGIIPGTHPPQRGNNRNLRIDAMCKRWNLAPGQYWCAIEASCVIADCGGLVPAGAPDCDTWLPFCEKEPRIMACVLYGKGTDARHIGFWARWEKDDGLVMTWEGNRSYHGGKNNNGIGMDLALITRDDILGFYHQRSAFDTEADRQAYVRSLEEVNARGY